MVKDRGQHIHIHVSFCGNLGEQAWVVNSVEYYSCGWTNQFIISYLSISLRWFKFMSYWNVKLLDISPLCDVAQTSDCGIVNLFVPFWGVISDTRLAFSITLGFREDYRPTSFLFPMHSYFIIWVRIINLFICIMFTFVISYVQTVLRVLS